MAQRERGASTRAAARAPQRPREPGVDLRALRARLVEFVEPVVTAADLDLDGLTVSPAGRRLVVRVIVDGEAGIGHDELSDISRDISAALDEAEEARRRPHRRRVRARGQLARRGPAADPAAALAPQHRPAGHGTRGGAHRLTGRDHAADGPAVTLDVGGPVGSSTELGPGRVQIEFSRPDRAGRRAISATIRATVDGDSQERRGGRGVNIDLAALRALERSGRSRSTRSSPPSRRRC